MVETLVFHFKNINMIPAAKELSDYLKAATFTDMEVQGDT
jgi:hypothetical protein